MHEMGLAANIIDMVAGELDRRGIERGKLRAVKITVGKMTQIVPESLRFGLGIKSETAGFGPVDFIINEAPLKLKCGACGLESVLSRDAAGAGITMACPGCGANEPKIIGGREFSIDSVDVDD